MKTIAILVAAGSAARMQHRDKLLLHIGGRSVLRRCADQFEACDGIDGIVVVARQDRCARVEAELAGLTKLRAVLPGGQTRQQSVAVGIQAAADADYLAIHDGARPFVTPALIQTVLRAAMETGAAAPAVPVTDTVKRIDAQGYVAETPDRATLRAVQTPQIFSAPLYRAALAAAERSGLACTDDCQLLEAVGLPVLLVPGDERNGKLTTWADVESAHARFSNREAAEMRVGHGYDVHRLTEGRALVLGGVHIPWERGLLGHSDADAAVHAVIDALLGAAALGDIGGWFPDSDEQYRDADSLMLLRRSVALLAERGYCVGNLDLTIVAQQPKLAPYIADMRGNLAEACGCPLDAVSVKATTTERLGFTGRGEGVAAEAVALLQTVPYTGSGPQNVAGAGDDGGHH